MDFFITIILAMPKQSLTLVGLLSTCVVEQLFFEFCMSFCIENFVI